MTGTWLVSKGLSKNPYISALSLLTSLYRFLFYFLHFFPYPKQNMRLIIREDYEEVSSYIGMYMQDVSCHALS